MKKIIFAILLPMVMFSQKRELGEVTIKELQEKQHPIDTSAAAAVLFEKGVTSFNYSADGGFEIETEVEVKIKIYKKEGYDWANKSVTYSIGSQNETVSFNKTITYNLENGKIVKTKLNSDGEFKEKNNEYWATKKITMPNVKEGSIIEYKYTIKSPFISKIDNWTFQSKIPVNYSEYNIHIPEYFYYNVYSRGNETIHKLENVEKRSVSFTSGKGGISELTFNENKTKYFVENLAALKTEAYSNSISNYLASIEFELASTHYPNSGVKQLSETWDDVVKTIYENDSFGKELDKNNYYEEDIKKIIATNDSQNDKINKIFEFVKNKIKWNEFVGIYADKGVKKAYQENIGNSAEINFILISMLRSAGLQANPILLTTRNKPINLYPSRTAFNYVICGVEVNNDVVLLDATDKYATLNVLPIRDLNYIGRIIRKHGSSTEINLMPTNHSKRTILCFADILNDGKITGNIKEILSDNSAYLFRDKNNATSQDTYLENFEKNNVGFEIKEYSIENKSNLLEPLKEDYTFESSNSIEVIDGKYYFKPLLIFGLDENPFKSDVRNYPIDFIFPTLDSYSFSFSVPQGYVVENLPSNINIVMVDNVLSFKYMAGQVGDRIQVICNFSKNVSYLLANQYLDLKEFYNQVFLKMNEKIVLRKQ